MLIQLPLSLARTAPAPWGGAATRGAFTLRRLIRRYKLALRQLGRTLLLPLLLLLAQQGGLLHELSHFTRQERQEEGESEGPRDKGPCEWCLAFAQIESAASPVAPPLRLQVGLTFLLVAAAVFAVRGALPPALHNRGPPARR